MTTNGHAEHFYAFYVDMPIRPLYQCYADQPEIIDRALMQDRAWDIAIGSSLPTDTSLAVNFPDGTQKSITVGALRNYLRTLL